MARNARRVVDDVIYNAQAIDALVNQNANLAI